MIQCEMCNKEAVHFYLHHFKDNKPTFIFSTSFVRCDACNIFLDPEKTQIHEFTKLTKSEYLASLVLES